jgi:hypothetical protein
MPKRTEKKHLKQSAENGEPPLERVNFRLQWFANGWK